MSEILGLLVLAMVCLGGIVWVLRDHRQEARARRKISSEKALGISIRMVEQYQISADPNPSRLDWVVGAIGSDDSARGR